MGKQRGKHVKSGMSRRRLFQLLGTGAVGVAGMSLAACGGDEGPGTATAVPEETETAIPTFIPTLPPVGSPVAGYGGTQRWAGRTVTVAAWGGEYEAAQQTAFFAPFEEATGATVQTRAADLGRFEEQAANGEVSFDLLTIPVEDVLLYAAQGWLQPMDFAVIDKTALFPEAAFQHGVVAAYFSTVMIYAAGTEHAPANWYSFWEVPELTPEADIPVFASRALRRSPVGTLEFALLADGVAVEELYPLDIDRALGVLERIRPFVLAWYEDGKQPAELVASGTIEMASCWNVRASHREFEDKVRLFWFNGMLSADAWTIPAASENADVAMDLINFSTRAVPSANFSRLLPYGPVNPGAFEFLPPERAELLPTAAINRGVQFVQDWAWWARHRDEAIERFETWLLNVEPATPAADG